MTRTSTRRPWSVALAATSLLGAVLLAGCSAASSSTSAASAPAVAGVSGGVAGTADQPAKDGATGSGTGELAAAFAATDQRSIVVTANVSVRVPDVTTATSDLVALASARGATVASQSTSSGGGTAVPYPTSSDGSIACPTTGCPTSYASSTTTLRIDNDKAPALITEVGRLGTVLSSTRTSDDITAQVADVDARVRNAQASLARIRTLMSKATSVGDVVSLEGELSKREADLEALQARQRTFADQSAQATVTVQLLSTDAPVAAERGTGFVAGLRAGWDAFTAALVGALTVLGALLPFLVVLVPLGLLVRWWVRRRTPRPAAPAPLPMAD